MIKGGPITNSPPGQQSWGSLAVSPDGTKLALTVNSIDRVTALSPAYSDKIIVIDLLTGQRTQWQGGLFRTGKQFSIPDLSWSADGRSLIFLGQWCDPPGPTAFCSGGSGAGCVPRCSGLVAQRRDRRRLADPRPLAATTIGPIPPHRASARRPRGGFDLTVAVLSGQVDNGNWRVLTVEDVSAASETVRHVDYGLSLRRGQGRSPQQVWLTADPSGQHLLVSYAVDGGFTIGWIGHGALHRLPIRQPYLPSNAPLTIAW